MDAAAVLAFRHLDWSYKLLDEQGRAVLFSLA
jgi:hypothetical protein